jgi:hypothetical protein
MRNFPLENINSIIAPPYAAIAAGCCADFADGASNAWGDADYFRGPQWN